MQKKGGRNKGFGPKRSSFWGGCGSLSSQASSPSKCHESLRIRNYLNILLLSYAASLLLNSGQRFGGTFLYYIESIPRDPSLRMSKSTQRSSKQRQRRIRSKACRLHDLGFKMLLHVWGVGVKLGVRGVCLKDFQVEA